MEAAFANMMGALPSPIHEKTPNDSLGALGAGLLVTAFCLVMLWLNPRFFWNDDYQLAFLPVFKDMSRAWWNGEFPLLTQSSWVAGNLAGEFQYGVFSIFMELCVIVIFKLPL